MKTNHRRPRRLWAGTIALAMAVGLFASLAPASASHPEVSLDGSDFEIDTDANLKVDDGPPSIDWADVDETRQTDLRQGEGDNSFTQGAKEDTVNPAIDLDSIPPNKSDLLTFGTYLEETAGGDRFLNVYWHRVQEPQGTTNMDFEFNQSDQLSANGVTRMRTSGDILIQYNLSQGGTNPNLFVSRWIDGSEGATKNDCEASNKLPCWSTAVDFTGSDATGSINASAIPAADADGLGAISARTFGEAQVDFDAIIGDTTECIAFGSAFLKSRSSDSFTAALKDFTTPVETDISLCGKVKVVKTDDADPANLLDGAEFDLVVDEPPTAADGQTAPGAEDTEVADSCTTVAGVCEFDNVFQGNYWVVETMAPAGHDPADPPHQAVVVEADETVEVTFVNPRQQGAIEITKTRKHAASGTGDHAHEGVTFTVSGGGITPMDVVTDENGKACVDGLLFDDYTVTETVPAGYVADGDTAKAATVNQGSTCGDGNEAKVSFGNTPLTDFTVSVDSQVDGGTHSTVTCTGPGTDETTSITGNGDGSLAVSDRLPGVYTCTIDIDP